MPLLPKSDAGLLAGVLAIPVVCVLVWLFNAHRLGRFKTTGGGSVETGKKRGRRRTLAVCGTLFVLAVAGMVILWTYTA